MGIADLNFLVAEDNVFQRRALVMILNGLGAENIVEAANGQEALDAFQNSVTPIDIAVIDLNMPSMDGMELIRHLAHGDYQTSVILATAHDRSLLFSVGTMSKAYGVRLLGTIEKPATSDKLQTLINQYVPLPSLSEGGVIDATPPSFDDIIVGLKHHQFEPFFQPKVNLDTGRVEGAEAFARWLHPEKGIILPDAFISTLEAHGRIDVLSWIIIDKSVAACRDWHALGFDIAVSINLSPYLLKEPQFSEQIVERISQYGIDPHLITFEFNEALAGTNNPHLLENLSRLRMKGFGLSIDDYGTGDSNIQQLALIPFSELKIDRSFVVGASQSQALGLVLSSSLELAKKLNRQSVAVGIETKQDWDFLHSLGCGLAQGYYIGKPMEAAAFPEWMKEWSLFF